MVQMLTQLNPRQTVVSVDGVGAFDLVSRNAMLQGLGNMIGGAQVLPFVRLFYSDPSTYVWEDEVGEPQMILQGEGGEQGDPLMPLLFSLGQHAAIECGGFPLGRGRAPLRIPWMICMCSATQHVSLMCMQFFNKNCRGTQGYRFTKARRRSGIREVLCQSEWNVSRWQPAGLTLTPSSGGGATFPLSSRG